MQLNQLLIFLAGLVLGALLIFVFRPVPQVATESERLIDGKYFIVQGESGHWIYERSEEGLKVVNKEVSPVGLRAIWELQSEYRPQAIEAGDQEVINIPMTRYNTESGSFQVVHKFFKVTADKLVEIPMEQQPAAPAPR